MTAAQMKAIKTRFEQLLRERVQHWEAENPIPKLDVEQLIRDIEHGRAVVDRSKFGEVKVYLKEWLDGEFHADGPELLEAIACPALLDWRVRADVWKAEREEFVGSATKALSRFQDRVLFDCESPLLMMQAFERFGAPDQEGFGN